MRIVALVAVVLGALSARADQAPDEDAWLAHAELDVIVATVEKSADGTNGAPPRVKLRIEETLRGAEPSGPADAIWLPPPRDSKTRSAAWKTQKLPGPITGERLILLGRTLKDHFEVSPHFRQPFSMMRLARVRILLQAPK